MSFLTALKESFINNVWPRFVEMITAPWTHKEMFWVILPVLFGLLTMQIYFGRYKTEKLGWNTAFGNATSLFWVSSMLAKYMVENYTLVEIVSSKEIMLKALVVLIFVFWSLFLVFTDFFHFFHPKVLWFLSSSLAINLSAFIAIVLIYGNVQINRYTVVAGILLFLIVAMFFYVIKKLIKPSKGTQAALTRIEHVKTEEKKKKKEARKRKIKRIKEKIEEKVGTIKKEERKIVRTVEKKLAAQETTKNNSKR